MRVPFNGNFRLTQGFGENPEAYKKFGLLGHNGLDYGLQTGIQVVAPHSGRVIEAAVDPSGYGNYLKIENEKEGSLLAHLKVFMVQVGDVVTEGQPIALSNNTGNSTGPHLHWGYYLFPRNRQNGYNGFIDQINLMSGPSPAPMPEPIDNAQSMRQVIIDVYRGLCGQEPSEDEIRFRLDSHINTYDLIRDICNGDERFFNTWVKPKIASNSLSNIPNADLVAEISRRLK